MLPALARARGVPLGPGGTPTSEPGGSSTAGPESTTTNAMTTSGGAEKARIELGLKQAFQAADGDNSGTISVSELLDVIKKTGAAKGPSRGRPAPFGSKVVGMEDTTALLLSLAGEGVGGPAGGVAYSDAWLDMTVRKVFARLDVDGDGCISWWEWQAVLGGTLLGRSAVEKYLDPMDSLSVIVQVVSIRLTYPPLFLFENKTSLFLLPLSSHCVCLFT